MTSSDQLFAYAREQHIRNAQRAIYEAALKQAEDGDIGYVAGISMDGISMDGYLDFRKLAEAAVEAVRPSR